MDNAAASPVSSETLSFFNEQFLRCYSNQEAAHASARECRLKLDEAAEKLSFYITGTSGAGVFWTNSGTEALNAVLEMPLFKKGNTVSSPAEHPALRSAINRQCSEVRIAGVSADGSVDPEELERLLDANTVLAAFHHVQSETGALQNLCAISEIIKRRSPSALFLSDTIQSACKLAIPWKDASLDFAFVSGRKIGAPGGAAVIYRDVCMKSYFDALRSEQHRFSRVEPAIILTLAECAERLEKERNNEIRRIEGLNAYLRKKLSGMNLQDGKKIKISLPENSASPYILHFLLPGFQSAVILRMLSERGIMLAAGSACEAETKTPSPVLLAMGISKQDAYSALRISFWNNISASDLDIFLGDLEKVILSY